MFLITYPLTKLPGYQLYAMETLLQDIRYGLRMLRKNPVFTLVAVVTLALGIGANTAIFSVVDAPLLRPVSFPDTDHMVMVMELSEGPANDWTFRGVLNGQATLI